jgi:hypothetical protein
MIYAPRVRRAQIATAAKQSSNMRAQTRMPDRTPSSGVDRALMTASNKKTNE